MKQLGARYFNILNLVLLKFQTRKTVKINKTASRVTSQNSIYQKTKYQSLDCARADISVLNIRVYLHIFTRNSQDLVSSRVTIGWVCIRQ